MRPEEIIAIIAIALVIGGAVAYIIKAKKSGKRCIGCPDSASCKGECGGCSCGCSSVKKAEGENQQKK